MEFNIRQRATLPYLEVNLIKSGRLDYNYIKTDLSNATINFYMKNVDTGFYKVAKGNVFYSTEINSLYFQFNKRNTSEIGRFEGEFKVTTDQGDVILPLREKIFINVLKSFSDPDFCCIPNLNFPVITQTSTPTPSPTPTPVPTGTPGPESPKFYYGKFTGATVTSGDVVNLNVISTNSAVGKYVEFLPGLGYGYTIIPTTFTQPDRFVNSTNGCDGIIIPTNNIGTVVVNDINGFPVTYNVYRTFYKFNGQSYSYMCL
jgi:hypothetical protein